MAEGRRYALGNQPDIRQIVHEAQHRWLRPAEICVILQNYKRFHIASEAAQMPPSGSLCLYDRRLLRYFRRDGYNWRKKKDGKTIKEAHEKLKAGSVDVLHCYYAHGEDNENFQRRTYWLLEEDMSHIVLVHYREVKHVKGNRMGCTRFQEREEATPSLQESEEFEHASGMDISISSNFRPNSQQVPSRTTDTSLNSAQASEYEAESAYNQQASSRFRYSINSQLSAMENTHIGSDYPESSTDFGRLSAIPGGTGNSVSCNDFVPFQPLVSSTQPQNIPEQLFTGISKRNQYSRVHRQDQEESQSEDNSVRLSEELVGRKSYPDTEYGLSARFYNQEVNSIEFLNSLESNHLAVDKHNDFPSLNDSQMKFFNREHTDLTKIDSDSNLNLEERINNSLALKNKLLNVSLTDEGLKKIDSFSCWMRKELGDADGFSVYSDLKAYWNTIECENGIDASGIPSQARLEPDVLGPSLSLDQLFSIIDFSPNWAYVGSETKILITGRFLKNRDETEISGLSCMFGEVEVPAEVIADGVLRCHTPAVEVGRVPFYVTRSNRLACSEVREFEYRVNPVQGMDTEDYNQMSSEALKKRFAKILCLNSIYQPNHDPNNVSETPGLKSKISSLVQEENDEWNWMFKLTLEQGFSVGEVKEELLQKLLKEKLYAWLLHKAAEGGKGPNVLDEGGQGVLHFASALGYDWALEPTILCGVSVNFRDVNGWTALHWAAFCGRESTVACLISLGAAPGALTDPSPKFPSCCTPADLASANGHKGIAGYLAESALSAHLSSLELNSKERNDAESSGSKASQTVLEQSATPVHNSDNESSLKDTLAAFCNASQAAARIHQVYRVQSFQRKQLKEYGNSKFGLSDERALELIAVKTLKPAHHDEPAHAAAICIQNKFRSWKGRKEFLTIRQQIVKIQAHVRGHQVRKNYRKIIWSVGILEKVILRWRRKGSGLRGFKSEPVTGAPSNSSQDASTKEDEYDFLKEGRKQTEERLQKALARVKSMVQDPEARDQYCRLLNAVSEIKETKEISDRAS